jgi:Tol biopolymer transport system component
VVWQTDRLVEAPNFSPDGRYLLVNDDGLLYRLPLTEAGGIEQVDTGFATLCNNDHGISPDGSLIAICDKTQHGKSCIYILPASGGTPRQVTRNLPSYWHGWSPDGRTVAFLTSTRSRSMAARRHGSPMAKAAMTGRTGPLTGNGSISTRAAPA